MSEGVERADPAITQKPRKRFVGKPARANASGSARAPPRRVANQIPDEILNDPALKEAMTGEKGVGVADDSFAWELQL